MTELELLTARLEKLEKKAEADKKRMDAMEVEVQKARAYKDVQNLMAKYLLYHDGGHTEIAIEETFVKSTEGFKFAMGNGGTWRDLETYKRIVPDVGGNTPGKFMFHTIESPIVEIADDLKTAKACWMNLSIETMMWPEDEKCPILEIAALDKAGKCPSVDGVKVAPTWNFEKVACDFVCEDGEWKIWHMQTYDGVHANFYEDWVTFCNRRNKARRVNEIYGMNNAGGNDMQAAGDDENIPESIVPKNAMLPAENTFWYDLDAIYPMLPLPPKPYKNWDETFSY